MHCKELSKIGKDRVPFDIFPVSRLVYMDRSRSASVHGLAKMFMAAWLLTQIQWLEGGRVIVCWSTHIDTFIYFLSFYINRVT